MNISSAGIAASWAATTAEQAQQAVQTAMLRQHAQGEQAIAQMIEASVEATKVSPPPPGQGQNVDIRA